MKKRSKNKQKRRTRIIRENADARLKYFTSYSKFKAQCKKEIIL